MPSGTLLNRLPALALLPVELRPDVLLPVADLFGAASCRFCAGALSEAFLPPLLPVAGVFVEAVFDWAAFPPDFAGVCLFCPEVAGFSSV